MQCNADARWFALRQTRRQLQWREQGLEAATKKAVSRVKRRSEIGTRCVKMSSVRLRQSLGVWRAAVALLGDSKTVREVAVRAGKEETWESEASDGTAGVKLIRRLARSLARSQRIKTAHLWMLLVWDGNRMSQVACASRWGWQCVLGERCIRSAIGHDEQRAPEGGVSARLEATSTLYFSVGRRLCCGLVSDISGSKGFQPYRRLSALVHSVRLRR